MLPRWAVAVLCILIVAVWGVVVVMMLLRTGQVPTEYWGIPGAAVGFVLAAARTDDVLRRRRERDGSGDSGNGYR